MSTKRILKTLAVMAVMLSLVVVPAVAQSELDQSQPIFNTSRWSIQEEHVKQTFTAQKTGTLDTVVLHVECFSLCASFNNGGFPTLMHVRINGTGVTDVHGDPPRGGEFLGDNASIWYTIPIYPAPFVQAGQQYEIEVWLQDFWGPSTLLHGADSDVYPGGEFFYQDRYWDGDNWVTDWETPSASTNGGTHDLAFRTYVTPAPLTLNDQPDLTVEATGPDGAAVTFDATATSRVDPTPAVSCTTGSNPAVPVSSGDTFPLGATTVTCTATDAAGNKATGSFVVRVVYDWSGVLQPVNADGSSIFKLGTTVPVKFALTSASAVITDATAKLTYRKVDNGIEGTIMEATPTATATSGNLFRYDATSKQYVFNWGTKGLESGTYKLSIDLGDGTANDPDAKNHVLVSLKK